MFKTYLNNESEPNKNTRGVSPGSWGKFSRKSYYYGDQDHHLPSQGPFVRNTGSGAELDSTDSTQRRCNKAWIWVGIGIVYLAAVGIVIAVLLLAPKYPSVYYSEPPTISLLASHENQYNPLVELDQGIPEPEVESEPQTYPHSFQHVHHNPSNIQKFIPSPRDEVTLYDINPRRIAVTKG